jgi:hypothetical protein
MKVESLCEPGSAGRMNEDAVFCLQTENEIIAAVIDGATERLPSTALLPLLQTAGGRLTSAALAARTTRTTLATVTDRTPRDMLIAANDTLRSQMEAFYGELTPEAVFAREPVLAQFRHDLRLMRMVLPVCVITVVKINPAENVLSFAHLGDSTLLLFHNGGITEVAAGDNGRVGTGGVIGRAREHQRQRGLSSFREILNDPQIVASNHQGALYHNYVDAQGQPDLSRGIGVINGLPEAEAFIQHGTRSLVGLSGVFLFSDGLMWPAEELDESDEAVANRLQHMRHVIERQGLRAYYQQLHDAEEMDADFNRFPRFKLHDDKTGIGVFL